MEIKTLHTKNELFGRTSGTSLCSKEPDFSFVSVWSITSKIEFVEKEMYAKSTFLRLGVGSLSLVAAFGLELFVSVISTRH